MRFVGIDPSTKTGLVALDEDGNVLKQKELKGIGNEDPKRIVTLTDELMDYMQPDDVRVIESPGLATQRAVQAGWIHGSMRNALYRRSFHYYDVAPSAVKKFVGVTGWTGEKGSMKRLKGKEKKDAVAEAVLKHYGYSHPSDNVVDAYIMAQIARGIWYTQSNYWRMRDYQEEVIQTILNPAPKTKKGKKGKK